MKNVYNVIYFRNDSLYNISQYENEYFSSFEKAKKFMLAIIDEEKRDKSDWDFYYWKIKLIKSKINKENHKREFIYDMEGNLIFDSSKKKIVTGTVKPSLKNVGKIVKVSPFPWNKYSFIPIEKYAVVGDLCNNKYILYTIDNYKIVHLHEFPESLEFTKKNFKNVPKEVLTLSKIFKKKLNLNKKELFNLLESQSLIKIKEDLILDFLIKGTNKGDRHLFQ